jgi:hypothetical protein
MALVNFRDECGEVRDGLNFTRVARGGFVIGWASESGERYTWFRWRPYLSPRLLFGRDAAGARSLKEFW